MPRSAKRQAHKTSATEEKNPKKFTPVTKEYTFNLHRATYNKKWKKHAPKAVKALREWAKREMRTGDVRIATSVNQFIWSKGIRRPPHKIRVRLSRRKNEDEDAKEEMYTLVTHVPTDSFKKLMTKTLDQV